jgi:hypothetical protein
MLVSGVPELMGLCGTLFDVFSHTSRQGSFFDSPMLRTLSTLWFDGFSSRSNSAGLTMLSATVFEVKGFTLAERSEWEGVASSAGDDL